MSDTEDKLLPRRSSRQPGSQRSPMDVDGISSVSSLKKVRGRPKQQTLTCYDCKSEFSSTLIDPSALNDSSIYEAMGFRWHCSRCLKRDCNLVKKNDFDTKINEISKQLNFLTSEFNRRLDDIENQNQNFPKEVRESISTYAQVVSKNIENHNQTTSCVSSMKQSLESLKTDLNNQMEDKSKSLTAINNNLETVKINIEKNDAKESDAQVHAQKINNVCIFNIPELNSENLQENYKNDVQIVKELFNDRISLNKEDVKSLFRKGEIKDSLRPRPIIIKFSTTELKNKVLSLRNLTYTDKTDQTEHQIFIVPDRTRKEQLEHKKLTEELKKRRQDGEQNIIIRNGKIVSRLPFRSNPQLFWG